MSTLRPRPGPKPADEPAGPPRLPLRWALIGLLTTVVCGPLAVAGIGAGPVVMAACAVAVAAHQFLE